MMKRKRSSLASINEYDSQRSLVPRSSMGGSSNAEGRSSGIRVHAVNV